jgi:hypothetical protein
MSTPAPTSSLTPSAMDVDNDVKHADDTVMDTGDFQLSAVLSGHSSAARDGAIASNDLVAIAEERGHMAIWNRDGTSSTFTRANVLHENVCLFCVPPPFFLFCCLFVSCSLSLYSFPVHSFPSLH